MSVIRFINEPKAGNPFHVSREHWAIGHRSGFLTSVSKPEKKLGCSGNNKSSSPPMTSLEVHLYKINGSRSDNIEACTKFNVLHMPYKQKNAVAATSKRMLLQRHSRDCHNLMNVPPTAHINIIDHGSFLSS